MATSPRNSLGNVRSDMDIVYPEHFSRLYMSRHSIDTKSYYNPTRSTKNRHTNRYRTQPVTFYEIKEVDDEKQELDDKKKEGNDKKEGDEENTGIDNQKSDDQTSFLNSKKELKKFKDSFGAIMRNQIMPDDNGAIPDAMKNVSNGAEAGGQTRWLDYKREGSV